MNVNWRFAGVPVLAIALLNLSAAKAVSEPGLNGSYAGVPVDVGNLVTNSGVAPTSENVVGTVVKEALRLPGFTSTANQTGSAPSSNGGVQFQGRYDLPNSPLSVRGSLYVGDRARAVMPAVTYDVPVAKNTNVYAGAGVSFVKAAAGKSTPLGSQTGVMITTGVESEISKGVIVYGDAKWLPGNQGSVNEPIRYQLGVGHRF
ncbi:MAG: hypothetical protein HC866_23080 [Leptolyngbyaceae cyanobacterium RU_5_1]|nr:hypothetical protein [Leptolyngbyaceae cyanobacterium RU_5_1]